jgi:hypothetical protein
MWSGEGELLRELLVDQRPRERTSGDNRKSCEGGRSMRAASVGKLLRAASTGSCNE